MNKKDVGLVLAAFGLLFVSQVASLWLFMGKSSILGKFNLQPDKIAKDLDGKSVNLTFNQVWPFDVSQNLNLQIIGKKQVDDYVIVIADVKALAAVAPQEPKEQTSVSPTGKDVPRTSKWPSRLQLTGRLKLTYELIDNEWYLLTVDNLNLKAIPLE
jgi:hypothetical protein